MANNLTMTSPTYGAGKFGNALTGGSGASANYPTGQVFTFECWFKTSATGGSNKVILSIGRDFLIFMDASTNKLNAGSTVTMNSPVVNDGVYHHLEFDGSSSGVTIFLDGAVIGTGPAISLAYAAGDLLTIGTHQSFGFNWSGIIDEFVAWTTTRHTTAFTAPTAAYASGQTGMYSLYHFDGDGTDSAVASTAPSQMVAPAATAGNASATVALTVPSNGGSVITGYTVISNPAGGVDSNAGSTSLNHTMTGLTNGTVYTFTATATNTVGTSAASPASNSVTPTAGATANIVSITDTKVFWSPYNWDNRGSYKVTGCSGAYVKIGFSGTSIAVNVDVSALVSSGLAAASYPRVRAIFDGITAIDTQLTSSTTAVSRTGMASGNHTLEFFLDATDDNNGDFWNTPTNNLSITGFTIDQGAVANQWTPRGKNMLWYGDSISRGYKSLSISDTMPLGNSNAITIPPSFAKAFGAEIGLVAYSGQGFEQQGGNTPGLLTSYNFYTSGRSRLVNGLLVPAPDYICSMHGTNGATTQADVQSFITKARAMAPNAIILMIVPASGAARSALTSGVAAQADAKAFVVDIGTDYTAGINNYTSVQNYWSWDGLHYNALSNTRIGAATTRTAQAAIDGAVSPTLTARTITFQLATGTNQDGSPIYAANLTGAKIAFYDEASPDLHTLARYRTASGTFNATGTCTFVAQSTLAAGGTGSVVVWIGTNRYTSSVVVS